MKNWIKTMLVVSVLCLSACSDDPDVGPLKRDTDAIDLAYNTNATNQISVRYAGSWSARIECLDENGTPVDNWFGVSPADGIGNGREYQWITVTAERNAGDKRTGYVYVKPANGQEVKIEIVQADGRFSVSDPVITGTLRSNTEASAALEITYDKAFGGEAVEIVSVLEGIAAEGLHIADTYQSVIDQEGSGKIVVPITGTPASLGELICNVTFKLDGVVKFQGEVAANVSSSNELFRMGFDLFVWGGDYPNNKKGPGPNGTAGAGKEFKGKEPAEPDMITAGTDGTSDVFSTMTAEYRGNRNVSDWSGQRVYEHPGYVKLGVTANGGWIMTPELAGLSAAPETVAVSIDFLRFDNEKGTYVVSAEGAGIVTNGEVNNTVLPAQTSAAGRKWTTLTFTVKDATNKTRIRIEAQTMNETGYRINIDNIVVMAAEKAAVTEKLPAPDPEKITYTPNDTSIAFAWEGVKGATSYEVSLALQTRPEYRKTIETENSDCEFTDLEPGLYVFTVRALYAENTEFNSDETSKIVGTTGFAVQKLETPMDLVSGDVTSLGGKVSWAEVNGAAGYKVVVKKTVDGTQVSTKVVKTTTHTITGLAPGTGYTVTVQALVGDGSAPSEFDSDEVSVQFTTADPVALSKPTLTLYHKSHGLAVAQFGFDVSEQVDTKFNIQLLDGGDVIRDYSGWSFNAKYTKPGTRFMFGGLEANKSYSAKIQRVSLDTNMWLDSEWSAPLAFTTDPLPDKSGYLLWQDFDAHPWGGNGPLLAFGMAPKGSHKDFDVTTGISTTGWEIGAPVKNLDNLGNGVGTNVGGGSAAYHRLFMPDWDSDELSLNNKNTYTGSVYLCGGMMKFGTGSSMGRLTLPKFTGLTSASTLLFTFNASAYYEPNGTTGSLQVSPAVGEGVEFMVAVTAGPGTIAEADGSVVNAASIKLKNKTATETQADTKGYYEWTGHTVKVTGATAETRIAVYTINAAGSYRMWLDDLKVQKQ